MRCIYEPLFKKHGAPSNKKAQSYLGLLLVQQLPERKRLSFSTFTGESCCKELHLLAASGK